MGATPAAHRRLDFIAALAHFLVHDQAKKSIELEMGKPAAKEWAELRGASPLMGYPTEAEAVRVLTAFFEKK